MADTADLVTEKKVKKVKKVTIKKSQTDSDGTTRTTTTVEEEYSNNAPAGKDNNQEPQGYDTLDEHVTRPHNRDPSSRNPIQMPVPNSAFDPIARASPCALQTFVDILLRLKSNQGNF